MNLCFRTLSVSHNLLNSVLLTRKCYFSTHRLISNGISIARKDKKRGEDAYYISENSVAVADGVGGWADCGVDPGEFSRELVSQLSSNLKNPIKGQNEFQEKVVQSVDSTITKIPKGSSTLCSLVKDSLNDIYLYNIGDSGLFQYRYGINPQKHIQQKNVKTSPNTNLLPEWYICFASSEQLHGFNFPAQLGKQGDNPNKGKFEKLDIQKNDLFLLGTDGLFDNLFHNNITDIINKHKDIQINPDNIQMYLNDILHNIVDQAVQLSQSKKFSPFEYSARMAGYQFKGGKEDDITAILSLVI
ncbi:hypothetical protein WA158_004602 [Blastocystis sp. Blastoise]